MCRLKACLKMWNNFFARISLLKNVIRNAGLEVHLVDHCNLKCRSCMHYSPIMEPFFVDIGRLENDFKVLALKEHGFFKRIRLMGGEPLLHPEIEKIVNISRYYFPKKKIVLVTNGIMLEQMKQSFYDTLKKNNILLKITKYPINLDYGKMTKMLLDKGVTFKLKQYEHAKSFLNPCLSEMGHENFETIYVSCPAKITCNQLRNGKIYSCPTMAYFDGLKKNFNLKYDVSDDDFISLDDISGKNSLWRFILKPKLFCKHCGLHKNICTSWSVSRCQSEEWICLE